MEQVKMALRFVDGKFMRGDVEVPVEIGNREQIDLLRAFEEESDRIEKAAKKGEYEVNVFAQNIRYTVACEFKCVCGHYIRECNCIDEYAVVADDLLYVEWGRRCVECPECNRAYKINGSKATLCKK